MKWVGDLDIEKTILLNTIYIAFFFFLNFSQLLKLINLQLHFKRTNIVQKIITMCTQDDRSPHQESKFFIVSKEVGLSLGI